MNARKGRKQHEKGEEEVTILRKKYWKDHHIQRGKGQFPALGPAADATFGGVPSSAVETKSLGCMSQTVSTCQ